MISLFTLTIVSCSPEDGKDGQQGIPGEDGNANVKSYLFENVNLNSNDINNFEMAAITKDILDNGAVLAYISNDANVWTPLPLLSDGIIITISSLELGSADISTNFDVLTNVKFIIIGGSPGNGGKTAGKSSQQSVYDELKLANVNVNDSDAVVAYFNNKS